MADINKESQSMLQKLTAIFKQFEYNILFEGIETDKQEEMCIDINANYLQGYKYSKPIPIEYLKDFLPK